MRFSQLIGAPGVDYACPSGNVYLASGSGLITGGYVAGNANGISTTGVPSAGSSFVGIQDGDIKALLDWGAMPATQRARVYNTGPVLAASATVTVASVAMTNGSLTIAAQPDVPRQGQFVVNPGSANITAGNLVLIYNNSDGSLFTDSLSLIATASTALTLVTSRGVSRYTSATVVGLVGGSSPNIQGGTNAVLALPADVGQSSLTVYSAATDDAPATLPTQSASDGHLITPATAPNGTHTYDFGYWFYSI